MLSVLGKRSESDKGFGQNNDTSVSLPRLLNKANWLKKLLPKGVLPAPSFMRTVLKTEITICRILRGDVVEVLGLRHRQGGWKHNVQRWRNSEL